MNDKLTSADMNEEMDDRSDKKPQTTAPQSPIILQYLRDQTEHISTKDNLSPDPVNVPPHKITETPICNPQNKLKSKTTRAVSICGPCSAENGKPKPHCPPPSSSAEACTILEVSRSFTSTSRSQESFKTMAHTEPEGEDLCAAILLACLFCHPLDCLLATVRGCNSCIWALCSSLCGCEPTSLQPLLDITHHCDLCGCLGVHCFLCDCSVCDICLQATECLDLAMEISQMIYH